MGSPAFATIPKSAAVTINVANANRTDAGTIPTILSAGAQGTKIERVRIKATGTTTAGMVRLWKHNGSANFLLTERKVAAIVPSGSVAAFEDTVDFSTPDQLLVLPPGWSLRASTHNAESFVITAEAADYPAP